MIHTINIIAISHIWTSLIVEIGVDSISGLGFGRGSIQYFVWKWKSSSVKICNCPATFDENEIIIAHNVARIVFVLLRQIFMIFIYWDKLLFC